MGSPVYALPAGNTNIEVLKDPAKLPLFVTFDIVIGETSMYADYIIPDTSYLERWEFHKSHPNFIMKNAPVRQPVIAPLTETATVYGIEQPHRSGELPAGRGREDGAAYLRPQRLRRRQTHLMRQEDYVHQADRQHRLRREAGAGRCRGRGQRRRGRDVLQARRHLPKTVFDVDAWKAAIDNDESLWRRTVTVLNRGGRFQGFGKLLWRRELANKYGKYVNMYCEKTYDAKDSMTGKHFSGVARYFEPGLDSLGNPVSAQDEAEGYDLSLITYRTITQTKSRTSGNYWLRAVEPTNSVILNSQDAQRLGLKSGDMVRIVSKTNPDGVWDLGNGKTMPMDGQMQVLEGLRPGVVGFNLGYGHWAYGANDVTIDGQIIAGRPTAQDRHPCQRRHAHRHPQPQHHPARPGGWVGRLL